MSEILKKKYNEYRRLIHSMQAGVGFDANSQDQTPKHLRVGINCAMSEAGALVSLLIKKGVITEEELVDEFIVYMQREVESYKKTLAKKYDYPPENITLV